MLYMPAILTEMQNLCCRCLPLPSELLELPPLAKLYSLKGLKPCKLTSGIWSKQVLELFLDLTGGKQDQGTLVKATIEPGNETTLYIVISGVTVLTTYCVIGSVEENPSLA